MANGQLSKRRVFDTGGILHSEHSVPLFMRASMIRPFRLDCGYSDSSSECPLSASSRRLDRGLRQPQLVDCAAGDGSMEPGLNEVFDTGQKPGPGALVKRTDVREGREEITICTGPKVVVAEVPPVQDRLEDFCVLEVIVPVFQIRQLSRAKRRIVRPVPSRVAQLAFSRKRVFSATTDPMGLDYRQHAARTEQ